MSGAWHGGKGSNYRKMDHEQFSDNWDRIFAKKKCLDCGETNSHHTINCPQYKSSPNFEEPKTLVTENGQD